MSERELLQLARSVNNLSKRVAQLEKQNRFTTATDWMKAAWWGYCSPTQPASKLVQVKGGIFWTWDSAAGTGQFRKLDDTVFDFSSCAPFGIGSTYRWCVLQLDVSANPPVFQLYEIADHTTEFGSAAECESDFWTNATDDDMWGSYIPLCAVVLKNDGNLGPAGAIENITLSDSDYSYMLARDFRPWLHLHAT